MSVVGSLGVYLGGYCCGLWSDRNSKAFIDLPIIGILATTPFLLTALFTPNFIVCITSLAFFTLFSETWLGPLVALQQAVYPSSIKGVGFSMYASTLSLTSSAALSLFSFVDVQWSSLSLGADMAVSIIVLQLLAVCGFVVLRGEFEEFMTMEGMREKDEEEQEGKEEEHVGEDTPLLSTPKV